MLYNQASSQEILFFFPVMYLLVCVLGGAFKNGSGFSFSYRRLYSGHWRKILINKCTHNTLQKERATCGHVCRGKCGYLCFISMTVYVELDKMP